MKAYIKPQTEIVEISVENNLMQAASISISVNPEQQNDAGSGRAKTYTFDIWGEDEE